MAVEQKRKMRVTAGTKRNKARLERQNALARKIRTKAGWTVSKCKPNGRNYKMKWTTATKKAAKQIAMQDGDRNRGGGFDGVKPKKKPKKKKSIFSSRY